MPNNKIVETPVIPVAPIPAKGRQKGQVNKTRSLRASSREFACDVRFTIFKHTDGKWYLQKARSDESKCICHNHLPVLPEHIADDTSTLSEDATKALMTCCNMNMDPAMICEFMIENYHVTVTVDQIASMRKTLVDNILIDLDMQPTNMTNAEKLITLFRNDPNVNYIYVMHDHESGFITYRKCSNGKEASTETLPTAVTDEINIQSWRQSLCLNESNKILVAFAWCHKDESRKVKINPQFLACDLTFKVNKENRNEFILAGIDGNNKSFTAFRCFMPSKQKRAYMWAIGVAFPVLVGESTCKRVRVFVHDNEEALVKAIQGVTNRPDSKFPFAKSMLDTYHFFKQRWQKFVS